MNILRLNSDQMRLWSLLLAIGLYAVLGLPTPDQPGLTEAAIGLLLIVAIGFAKAIQKLTIDGSAPFWQSAGQILLIYGLTLPIIMGLSQGQSLSLIIRDVIPFLFMALPIFLQPFISRDENHFQKLLILVLFLGAMFSIRASAEQVQFIANLSFLSPSAELTYLANAPTILFTVVFLTGFAGQSLVKYPSLKSALQFLGLGVLVLIVLTPIILTVQRANIGYAALSILCLTALGIAYYPYRTLPLLGAMALLSLPFHEVVQDIISIASHKTSLVGFNMRFEEMAAVWAQISETPLTLLLGNGWGASFESPAVAGIRVNFTHGLLTSALLKMGLVGALLTLTYILSILGLAYSHLQHNPVLVFALIGPILIDTLIYASFKSLDFGLILLLASSIPKVAKPR